MVCEKYDRWERKKINIKRCQECVIQGTPSRSTPCTSTRRPQGHSRSSDRAAALSYQVCLLHDWLRGPMQPGLSVPPCAQVPAQQASCACLTVGQAVLNLEPPAEKVKLYTRNAFWRHGAQWNKPVTKRQMLYDFTSPRSLEKADS